MGMGIAAAVIVPKILIESPEPKAVKKAPRSQFFPYEDEVKALHHVHYEEDMPRYTVEQLSLHDLCVDKDLRVWMCTGKMLDTIELTALEAAPEPNFIDVKASNFDEYFVIMGNGFLPGTGKPQ
jgi:hypothetical protein